LENPPIFDSPKPETLLMVEDLHCQMLRFCKWSETFLR